VGPGRIQAVAGDTIASGCPPGKLKVMANSTIDLTKGYYTYADLECLPEEERSHYELSYGALVVAPAPNIRHQQMLRRVLIFLERIALPSQEVLPEAELLIERIL
jgi:hypothetical protein